MSGPTKFSQMPLAARIAVSAFAVVAAIELVGIIGSGSLPAGRVFFLMIGLAAVTSRAKIRLPGGSTLSLLTSVVLATVMLLGTAAAVIVSMLGVVIQSSFPWKRKVPYRIAFNMGMVGLTVILAGTGYHAIVHGSGRTGDQLAGILTAAFIYYLCNSIFVSLIVSLTSATPVWTLWHSNFLYTAPLFFVEGLVALGAMKLASIIQFGVLAAFVPVLALTYYSVSVYLDSLAREKKHAAAMSALNETLEQRVAERSESLRIAKDLAEQASRAKSAFLANISHELRTPLNAIIGYSEMLCEIATETSQSEAVEDLLKIRSAGKHLLVLINDLLDLSKIEAGRVDVNVESFDLADVLEEVANTIQPIAAKNRNIVKISAAGPFPMQSDRTKISQVLMNVASNACKFTHAGKVSVAVSRLSADQGDCIQIRVSDTGIGIRPDIAERLFEPFVQADTSTTRRFGGTGLGLAISRKFCHLLGGDISVTSIPDEGSTFQVTLPIDISERQRLPEVFQSA